MTRRHEHSGRSAGAMGKEQSKQRARAQVRSNATWGCAFYRAPLQISRRAPSCSSKTTIGIKHTQSTAQQIATQRKQQPGPHPALPFRTPTRSRADAVLFLRDAGRHARGPRRAGGRVRARELHARHLRRVAVAAGVRVRDRARREAGRARAPSAPGRDAVDNQLRRKALRGRAVSAGAAKGHEKAVP
jgi:hypothetical protein